MNVDVLMLNVGRRIRTRWTTWFLRSGVNQDELDNQILNSGVYSFFFVLIVETYINVLEVFYLRVYKYVLYKRNK